ncbi:glycosyltransferase family 2 protein [Clostridium weizhouense]|uniref:Glycosyltransferase family 2 protein n=1 Tax=Clostridium weizhouense TaxID=2859781 RepID=A0ABS7AKR0_9CLOT|nr:glycosyltransferase family 2 protein [Clostridium weizhouense]MBW6409250.1 glycosyltransferase family 2 protein [Clostridium weizhouense]
MDKNITLSLCMIVKDEAKTLERCLSSVKSFIDEIIIVDTGSKDSTKDIAKKFNAKIYDFKWVNDFALARNFSFSKATSEYILWLDGDDFIDDKNIKNIEDLLCNFDKTYDYVSGEYILSRNSNGEVSYSLRRNRIVKRSMNFKWIGHVHEYLEVYGKGMIGEFAIEHGKVKEYTDRNLQIFRDMEKKKLVFTPRDRLYYANELKDNAYYKEAVKNYKKFLGTKQGWIEDVKTAYSKIVDCYKLMDMKDKVPSIIFESFQVDIPRADLCCSLGEYYIEKSLIKQSAFWYRVALDCRHEKGNPAPDLKDYYTWIPSLQLCLCYFKMGNLNCSYFFNELAASFIPNSEKIEYNRKYFKDEFNRRKIEPPKINYPIKTSDYVEYL